MAYIGKQPVVGNFVKLDAITTSATATYNLLNGGVAYFPQTANNCIVSLNGVIQSPTSAYTISGSTIVFSDALTSSDTIDFILVLGDVLSIGTPSDGTITSAKLATDLTVTHALGSASTPSITFTGDTNTGIFSPTADTIAFTEAGVESLRIDSSANLKFNSGYGSVATAYGCRAWVNFNGTGTPAIRASGNVTSITDNGTGDYTVNFTNAMPDANYSASAQNSGDATVGTFCLLFCTPSASSTPTTSSFRFITAQRTDGAQRDPTFLCVSVFR